MDFTKKTKGEREIEQTALAAQAQSESLNEKSDRDKAISAKVNEQFPMNKELAIIRKCLKALLDKNGITIAEFDAWNAYAKQAVASNSKKE